MLPELSACFASANSNNLCTMRDVPVPCACFDMIVCVQASHCQGFQLPTSALAVSILDRFSAVEYFTVRTTPRQLPAFAAHVSIEKHACNSTRCTYIACLSSVRDSLESEHDQTSSPALSSHATTTCLKDNQLSWHWAPSLLADSTDTAKHCPLSSTCIGSDIYIDIHSGMQRDTSGFMWLAALASLTLAAKLEEVDVPSTMPALQVSHSVPAPQTS